MSEQASKLIQCVNPSVVDQAGRLSGDFANAGPFRHVVIDDFFIADFCQSLIDEFPAFDEKLAINEDGLVGAKAVKEKIQDIGPTFQVLDELTRSEAFRELIGKITGIEHLNHDPYYFGGGTHENCNGQGLDAHVDFNYHPITNEHRRLNLIVYLNPEWQDEWGGSLQIHRDPYLPPSRDDITLVTPLINRCVIFETNEHSWHGFERIELPEDKQHLSRKSFALYYYTKDRPEKETAVEHSTIYVERHLPEWYSAGMTLDGENLQLIRNLVSGRDQHLKRLYGYIQNQNQQVHDLRYQLDQAVVEEPVLEPSNSDDEQTARKMSRLNTQLGLARRRVQDLESSTSWKLTAPVRAIKRLLARN